MKLYYHSPIGIIEIEGDEKGISACRFRREKADCRQELANNRNLPAEVPAPLSEAWHQLDEYFHGLRQEFSVRLNLSGTEFQKKVWTELRHIPFGETRSYGEIAAACGRAGAARAVGAANNRNPAVIFIPCHRVIGADGSLVGFGAGLWRKKWLLQHEKKILDSNR